MSADSSADSTVCHSVWCREVIRQDAAKSEMRTCMDAGLPQPRLGFKMPWLSLMGRLQIHPPKVRIHTAGYTRFRPGGAFGVSAWQNGEKWR